MFWTGSKWTCRKKTHEKLSFLFTARIFLTYFKRVPPYIKKMVECLKNMWVRYLLTNIQAQRRGYVSSGSQSKSLKFHLVFIIMWIIFFEKNNILGRNVRSGQRVLPDETYRLNSKKHRFGFLGMSFRCLLGKDLNLSVW